MSKIKVGDWIMDMRIEHGWVEYGPDREVWCPDNIDEEYLKQQAIFQAYRAHFDKKSEPASRGISELAKREQYCSRARVNDCNVDSDGWCFFYMYFSEYLNDDIQEILEIQLDDIIELNNSFYAPTIMKFVDEENENEVWEYECYAGWKIGLVKGWLKEDDQDGLVFVNEDGSRL